MTIGRLLPARLLCVLPLAARELAVYPVEDHGFTGPSSWSDEFRRIFELFEAHLPARTGAVPGAPR